MRIKITLDNGEKVVIHGISPLHFAIAIMRAHNYGKLGFQTKESIEAAVAASNATKVIS